MKPYEKLVSEVVGACQQVYGERLLSVAVFGSVARGTARPDSDLDIVIVASPLPNGRVARSAEFQQVEGLVQGLTTEIMPVFKTPEELAAGSPLLLDMVEDAQILFDKEGVLEQALARLRERLQKLGARRVWRGESWYWDLKPDYRPGEVFEL